MKVCPVCGSRCFDDMDVCYGCLHDFLREGSSPACQAVESDCEAEVEEAVLSASVVLDCAESSSENGLGGDEEEHFPSQKIGAPYGEGLEHGPARVALAREARRSTHIVLPLEGCSSAPVLTQEFRLVISLEPAV